MPRLYIGNLDERVDESEIKNVFSAHNLQTSGILVKKGFAFVDVPDQQALDNAIEELNGKSLHGEVLHVEPSVNRRRQSNRVCIKNMPKTFQMDDLQRLLSSFGAVQQTEVRGDEDDADEDEKELIVTYETPEQAKHCVAQMNGYNYMDTSLKVEYVSARRSARKTAPIANGGRAPATQGLPLSLLVPAETVGAVIGVKGDNIRRITQDSKARIDVNRQLYPGVKLRVKLVTISGQLKSVVDACEGIMKIVWNEMKPKVENQAEKVLHLLLPDNFCGRLIGRKGVTIKSIMEQSETHISVTRDDVYMYSTNRVVEVRGSAEGLMKAVAVILEKLRSFHENDVKRQRTLPFGRAAGGVYNPSMMSASMPLLYNSAMMMYGQFPPMGLPNGVPRVGGFSESRQGAFRAGSQSRERPARRRSGDGTDVEKDDEAVHGERREPSAVGERRPREGEETVHMLVPSSVVGSIIGSKGGNIREVSRASKAFISVERLDRDQAKEHKERRITIVGTPEAQWRAQFYIFDCLKNDLSSRGSMQDASASIEMAVPQKLIGRVIGKSGKMVRDIQYNSGAHISVPARDSQGDEGDVMIKITGGHYGTQYAQRRIRALLARLDDRAADAAQRPMAAAQ